MSKAKNLQYKRQCRELPNFTVCNISKTPKMFMYWKLLHLQRKMEYWEPAHSVSSTPLSSMSWDFNSNKPETPGLGYSLPTHQFSLAQCALPSRHPLWSVLCGIPFFHVSHHFKHSPLKPKGIFSPTKSAALLCLIILTGTRGDPVQRLGLRDKADGRSRPTWRILRFVSPSRFAVST